MLLPLGGLGSLGVEGIGNKYCGGFKLLISTEQRAAYKWFFLSIQEHCFCEELPHQSCLRAP